MREVKRKNFDGRDPAENFLFALTKDNMSSAQQEQIQVYMILIGLIFPENQLSKQTALK